MVTIIKSILIIMININMTTNKNIIIIKGGRQGESGGSQGDAKGKPGGSPEKRQGRARGERGAGGEPRRGNGGGKPRKAKEEPIFPHPPRFSPRIWGGSF